MREIRFRGKRIDTGEWVYGYVDSTMKKDIVAINTSIGTYVVDQDTVGQFTGLYDKNGSKIYEGDIIHTDYEMNAEVYWDKYSTSFSIRDEMGCTGLWDSFAKNSEVVGNIHDNPEMFEGGDK